MPDFNNKMHQNRNRLGLRPRPHWGNSRRSPRPRSRMERGIPPPHTLPPRRLHPRAFGARSASIRSARAVKNFSLF